MVFYLVETCLCLGFGFTVCGNSAREEAGCGDVTRRVQVSTPSQSLITLGTPLMTYLMGGLKT